MAFDIMNLFEETENVITELDEGNELAAVDFCQPYFIYVALVFGNQKLCSLPGRCRHKIRPMVYSL